MLVPNSISNPTPVKILVFGSSGMLGNSVLNYFFKKNSFSVYGVQRFVPKVPDGSNFSRNILFNIHDVGDLSRIKSLIFEFRPQVVINCVGVVKQRVDGSDPLSCIPINSLFPHQLVKFSDAVGARVIHLGTDCVFSGCKGNYLESDLPDATDLYGRSKLLGEVDYPNALTLRTSLIGHELNSSRSLVDWFLSQKGSVKGYRRAIFSGLPTVEIARVIHEYVLPNPDLRGVYHLSVDPISKFDLLSLVAKVYNKNIEIIPDDSVVIDRSLDSTRFRDATGFRPKPWPQLIQEMHDFR